MLRLEIEAPSVPRTYEFVVNEHVKVPLLIGELVQVISAKEGREWADDIESLILCDTRTGSVLPAEKTLYQCKVASGSKLILA